MAGPARDVKIEGSSVLVTGGCGFIGSHLVHELVERGASRVTVLDSLRYGHPSNLGSLASTVEVIPFDLGRDDPAACDDHLRDVTYLFHLAAEKHNQSKTRPVDVLRANVEGTYALLRAAVRQGVRKVIFTSSLYAYGRTKGPPLAEEEPLQPATVYGISKAAGEFVFRHFLLEHNLEYNVLRLFFIYGPRQFAGLGYKSVIVKNFERLRRGQPPVIYGDGTQALDYVYVADAVNALILALQSDACGEVFNVASGVATEVCRLIAAMSRVANSALQPVFDPPDWTAGTCRVGANEKIRRDLGWIPTVPLELGLQQTYDWISGRS